MIVIFPVQPLKFIRGTADNGRLGAVTVGMERLFSLSEAVLSWGFLGAVLGLSSGPSFVGLFRICGTKSCQIHLLHPPVEPGRVTLWTASPLVAHYQ